MIFVCPPPLSAAPVATRVFWGPCWVPHSSNHPCCAGTEPQRGNHHGYGSQPLPLPKLSLPLLLRPRGACGSLAALPSGAGMVAAAPVCQVHPQSGLKTHPWMHSLQTKKRSCTAPNSSTPDISLKSPSTNMTKSALGERLHFRSSFCAKEKNTIR